MQICVLQEQLSRIVTRASRFLLSKPQTPDQAAISLQVEGNLLKLSTENPSSTYSAHISSITSSSTHTDTSTTPTKSAKSTKSTQTATSTKSIDGAVAVPGRELQAIISSIRPGEISLTLKDQALHITGGGVSASLAVFERIEISPIQLTNSFTVSQESLEALVDAGALSAGVDETRPAFSSMKLEIAPSEFSIVSTDGFRLSKATTSIKKGLEQQSVVLPARTAKEAMKTILEHEGDVVTICVDESRVLFAKGDEFVGVRRLSIDYPNYSAIIPAKFAVIIDASAEELLHAVRAATAIDKIAARQQVVRFHFDRSELLVKSNKQSAGEVEVQVDIQAQAPYDPMEIAFNSAFLSPILQYLGKETAVIELNEAMKPVRITKKNETSFFAIIMPFRAQ